MKKNVPSFCWLILLAATFPGRASFGAEFFLSHPDQRVIGNNQYVVSQASDTLIGLARQYDLGFNEITAANPDIDPWLPQAGRKILIPTQFVIPDAPREGIVINIAEMRLYYFPSIPGDTARRVVTYPIGIGKIGFDTPLGEYWIRDKMINPNWTAPVAMVRDYRKINKPLRQFEPPGPDNPLGSHAMLLNRSGYLIHGTNKPFSIGMRVSYGCVRLYPEDIQALFEQVRRRTKVSIINQPFKVYSSDDRLIIEAHRPLSDVASLSGNLTPLVREIVKAKLPTLSPAQWKKINLIAGQLNGVPTEIKITTRKYQASREWIIQLAAFKYKRHAYRLAEDLAKSGISARLYACHSGVLCRVVVGPFNQLRELDAMHDHIRQTTGIDGIIRRYLPPASDASPGQHIAHGSG